MSPDRTVHFSQLLSLLNYPGGASLWEGPVSPISAAWSFKIQSIHFHYLIQIAERGKCYMDHLLQLAARPCGVRERSQFQLKDVTFARAQVKTGCNFRYILKEDVLFMPSQFSKMRWICVRLAIYQI